MQNRYLFEDYRVRGWVIDRRLMLIFTLSLFLNLTSLFAAAKGRLLTRTACDGPIVSSFCGVLDAIYIGGIVIGTDADYVDQDYKKTELANADVTWLDISSEKPLEYPEGYFSMANRDRAGIPSGMDLTGIPIPGISPDQNPAFSEQKLPPKNDNPISGELENPFDIPGRRPRGKPRNSKPDSSESVAENQTVVNPEDLVTETVTGTQINKAPLRDFANMVKSQFDSKQVDLEKSFDIIAEATLLDDGKLDVSIDPRTKQPRSRIIKTQGDSAMTEIAKQAIAAVGDSGWLIYLKAQGVDKINYQIVQDDSEIRFIITSEQTSRQRAETITGGLRSAIELALTLDANDVKKLGADEKTLLKSATPSFRGKQFRLDFIIPKSVAQEMIIRRLKELDSAEIKQNGQSEGRFQTDKGSK